LVIVDSGFKVDAASPAMPGKDIAAIVVVIARKKMDYGESSNPACLLMLRTVVPIEK